MQDEFEMSDLSQLNYFLRIRFLHIEIDTMMNQTRYTKELMTRFIMDKCNCASTPLEVGLKLEVDNDQE